MSEQNKDWNSLGKRVKEYRDDGGDWAANYARLREGSSEHDSPEIRPFSSLSLLLGVLLLFSIWGHAYQYGLGVQRPPLPCPSRTEGLAEQRNTTTQDTPPGETKVAAVAVASETTTSARGAGKSLGITGEPPASVQAVKREVPLPTADLFSEPLPGRPPALAPAGLSPDDGVKHEEKEGVRESTRIVPDGKPSTNDPVGKITVPPLPIGPYTQLRLEHRGPSSLLSAYRVGEMDPLSTISSKKKRFSLADGTTSLSVNTGLRVSGGFPYQVGSGPSLTSHVQVAYQLFTDGDGSPVGLEVGFFQGRPGWLNSDNVLYRTEQPATVLFANAPDDATVRYEVHGAWGVEIGMSEFSPLTDWLGIRSRLGLSILNYRQRFEQTSGGEPLDFSIAPQLAQPIGMYWNIGPELRFGKQGHLRLSYHGLIGNNARKAYFPGRNNGLEGVEFGLGWGF